MKALSNKEKEEEERKSSLIRKTPPSYTPSPDSKGDQTSLRRTTRPITFSTVLRNQALADSDDVTHLSYGTRHRIHGQATEKAPGSGTWLNFKVGKSRNKK